MTLWIYLQASVVGNTCNILITIIRGKVQLEVNIHADLSFDEITSKNKTT